MGRRKSGYCGAHGAMCIFLMERTYFVYIVANRRRGTLYTGVTNDLVRRTYEHREGLVEGFTKTHGCKHLVWYEVH
jgi:putative endonuclease